MIDKRLAEMADRYSTTAQADSQREWDKLDAAKEAFIPLERNEYGSLKITTIITDSFGEFVNSNEGRERIKQIIKNTALSGDSWL